MHELSLANAVVDTVMRHARESRVEQINLKVGRLRQVVPESLEFYFGIVSRGTLCEGAKLVQDVVLARLNCENCGFGWEPDLPAFRCPRCNGGETLVLSGEEFEVDKILLHEVEA
jgi:hydrogenase nickel incorporation protein HypA/HybF